MNWGREGPVAGAPKGIFATDLDNGTACQTVWLPQLCGVRCLGVCQDAHKPWHVEDGAIGIAENGSFWNAVFQSVVARRPEDDIGRQGGVALFRAAIFLGQRFLP